MKFLTVFTPTYNRGYLLYNLYKSLCEQKNQNFKWLIVDDGSTDDTEVIVSRWIAEGRIEIMYVKQENRGKHVAHNRGVELCDTELFLCVDSDDILKDNAIEIIWADWEETIEHEDVEKIMGYCTRRQNLVKEMDYKCFDNWPQENSLIYSWELPYKYRYSGETALVWVTKELKKYAFPVIVGEKFVTETVLYFQFKKPMKVKAERFYQFSYQPDGYTNAGLKLMIKNPIGTAMGNRLSFLMASCGLKNRLRAAVVYYSWNRIFHISSAEIDKIIKAGGYTWKRSLGLTAIDIVASMLSAPGAYLYERRHSSDFNSL